jgi:hypothetical protein
MQCIMFDRSESSAVCADGIIGIIDLYRAPGRGG